MTKLKCYKCGGELVAKKNHNIAVCQECNSLILLPNYVFDDTKELDEKIKITEKINKAIDYQLNYQFHHAYNQYDKLFKQYPEYVDNEYFFYFGQFLAQYGIIYHYNDRLENVPVSLQVCNDAVFENENYQKSYELMDLDTQIVFKKEINTLDDNISSLYRNALKYKPIDIVICIDDSKDNSYLSEELLMLEEVKKYCDNNKYTYYITKGLFNKKNIDNYLNNFYPVLKTADLMIVITHNEDTLNDSLFRHTWMSFLRLPENKKDIDNRFIILTSERINNNYQKYNYTINDFWNKKVTNDLEIISNLPCELNILPEIQAYILDDDFKNAKIVLNDIKDKNYLYWWNQLLVKYEVSSFEELQSKNIIYEKEYYYKQTYLKAPKEIRKKLYTLYESSTSMEDETYEANLDKVLENIMIKKVLNFIKWSLVMLLFIVLSFMTCSLKHLVSIIIFILGLTGITIPLIRSYMNIVRQGKNNVNFNNLTVQNEYLKQMKRIMTPDQVASMIPFKKQKRLNIGANIIIMIVGLLLLSFIGKEINLMSQYSNLEYYYVFEKAYISGGDGKHIIIPSKIGNKEVVKINDNAFMNNDKIESIQINYGLETIGNKAFYDCDNLKEIVLPASLKNVGNSPAFEECNNLILLIYSGKISEKKLLGDDYQIKMLNLEIKKSNNE